MRCSESKHGINGKVKSKTQTPKSKEIPPNCYDAAVVLAWEVWSLFELLVLEFGASEGGFAR
jgi:hypothetical protein